MRRVRWDVWATVTSARRSVIEEIRSAQLDSAEHTDQQSDWLTDCRSVGLFVCPSVGLSVGRSFCARVGGWLKHQWYIFVCFVDMELKTHNLRKHHLYPLTHTPTDRPTDRPRDRILCTVSVQARLSQARLSQVKVSWYLDKQDRIRWDRVTWRSVWCVVWYRVLS